MVPVPLNAGRRALELALIASVAVHVGAMDLLAPLGDAARRALAMLEEPPLLAVTLVLPAPRSEQLPASSALPETPIAIKPRRGGMRGAPNVALATVPARSESTVVSTAPAPHDSANSRVSAEDESAAAEAATALPAAASASAIAHATVSSPVAYLSSPLPAYPDAARRDGQQGLTILDVRVSKSGVPMEITIAATSGFPALDAAAAAGVTHWLFTPATKGGEAIDARIRIPVRFRLAE